MKPISVILGTIVLSSVLIQPGLAISNYLFNPQFSSGIAGWHGIGEIVYLKPDGTESADPVEGAEAVLKIPLKPSDTREVSQEFETVYEPNQLHLRLEVCASRDFKRSSDPQDYTQSWKSGVTRVSRQLVVPQDDFWVRVGPGWVYYTAKVSRKWSTVDVMLKKVDSVRDRIISFCVPCGQGSIYIRNPQVAQPAAMKRL